MYAEHGFKGVTGTTILQRHTSLSSEGSFLTENSVHLTLDRFKSFTHCLAWSRACTMSSTTSPPSSRVNRRKNALTCSLVAILSFKAQFWMASSFSQSSNLLYLPISQIVKLLWRKYLRSDHYSMHGPKFQKIMVKVDYFEGILVFWTNLRDRTTSKWWEIWSKCAPNNFKILQYKILIQAFCNTYTKHTNYVHSWFGSPTPFCNTPYRAPEFWGLLTSIHRMSH